MYLPLSHCSHYPSMCVCVVMVITVILVTLWLNNTCQASIVPVWPLHLVHTSCDYNDNDDDVDDSDSSSSSS